MEMCQEEIWDIQIKCKDSREQMGSILNSVVDAAMTSYRETAESRHRVETVSGDMSGRDLVYRNQMPILQKVMGKYFEKCC